MDPRFAGIRFPPAEAGLSRPGHGRPAAPIFPPPRAGQGMPVGRPLLVTKSSISIGLYLLHIVLSSGIHF